MLLTSDMYMHRALQYDMYTINTLTNRTVLATTTYQGTTYHNATTIYVEK